MPDVRKRLEELRAEWEDCTACDLGVRRMSVDGEFIFGEGARRGVMFIGDGHGEMEEKNGRPFVGEPGRILRGIIAKLGLTEFYMTSLVACRSATQRVDADNQPMFRNPRRGPPIPLWKDEAPLPIQIKACMSRLHEEIYLVDPVVIVICGGTAAEALLGKKFTITKDRGEPERLVIPGASFVPVLTEKRQAWFRKLEGKWVAPVERNEVAYYAVPTIHPAWVHRKLADQRPDSPFRKLAEDIRFAVKVYEQYQLTVYGAEPTGQSDTPVEELKNAVSAEDDNQEYAPQE